MPASGAARSGSLARSLAILGAGAYLSARAIDAAVNGLDARGRRVALAGRQLHVLDEGEGRAVLLLHGLLGCGSNFQMGLTSALRASGHRVIVPDRAGYGKSPPGPSGISDQAAQMLDLMDALGIKSCTVCGHSLGGAIALRMAVMAPERIGRLSLLAPACFLPASQPFAWMIPALPVLVPTLRAGSHVASPGLLAAYPALARMFFHPEPPRPGFFLRGGGGRALRSGHLRAAVADGQAVAVELEARSSYDDLTVPVDILTGSVDPVLVPAQQALALAAQRPDLVTVTMIEGAGHMIPVTHPRRCADHIAASVRKADPGQR